MCGRRSGKTTTGEFLAGHAAAIQNCSVGWFAPNYKYLLDAWREIKLMLGDAIVRVDSQEKRLEMIGGGFIDFWTMDSDDPARGRKYSLAIIDECGIVKNLLSCWQSAIRPTLVDYRGSAYFLGTPKGRREFFQLFAKGESGDPDWASFRLETGDNPMIDKDEIEAARRDLPPKIFDQEFRGIPDDDGGNPFGIPAIAACYDKPKKGGKVAAFGVDLAKSQDWTVVVGLSASGEEVVFDRWQHVPWHDTIERICRIVGDTQTLVDSTGVGDPVLEQIQKRVPQAEGYIFSLPSKQRLMEGLAVGIQSGSLALSNPTLRMELEQFGYEYTAHGVRYSGPEGAHDDTVCALALARQRLVTLSLPAVVTFSPTQQVMGGVDLWDNGSHWQELQG